jgi:hypothetical protein
MVEGLTDVGPSTAATTAPHDPPYELLEWANTWQPSKRVNCP